MGLFFGYPMFDLPTYLDGFESWLNKSLSENDILSKHNWQNLMKWVTPLKEKSLEYLAQLYSAEFSKV